MAVTKSLRFPKVELFKSRGRKRSVVDVQERVEHRVGKVALLGRYHNRSHPIENDYTVTPKVLGTGCNGAVWLATQKGQPSRKFAVKALSLSHMSSSQLERLKAEVENFLCMDHPHVTRLHDVYESATHLHLVMECLEGGELFDRVAALGRFSEADTAQAMWQMLLAVNYIHSHGIVHRDIKLENFLYDKVGGTHLKLIDFGFSKMWDPSVEMHDGIGTTAYMAPEVLGDTYTSQCDLWSMGVISFILLSGYMPFAGPNILADVQKGKYGWRPDRWAGVSEDAQNFMKCLLQVDPIKRLTAQSALLHPWLALRRPVSLDSHVDVGVVEALRGFGSQPPFRRCCLEMIAWVLSNEERARVREYFISMDANGQGTLSLDELRMAMRELGISDEEVLKAFAILDTNHHNEIHYSDFLAAMVSTKIDLDESLLDSAFRRFDSDGSGDISVQDLRAVLGDTFEGKRVESLLKEVDHKSQNRISYSEFVTYLRLPQAVPPVPLSPSKVSIPRLQSGCSTPSRKSSLGNAVKGICSAVLCAGPSRR